MPLILQIKCQACGHAPGVKNAIPGLEPIPTGGGDSTCLPSDCRVLETCDGKLIRLHHPGETSQLHHHGYTWEQAACSGRLLNVTFKLCTNCGTIHEEGRVTNGISGCGSGILITIAVLLLVRFLTNANFLVSIPISVVAGFLAMIVVLQVSPHYTRLRWRRKNESLKVFSCHSCNGKTFVSIGDATRKLQMCPNCHTQNMQYECVAIS